MTQPNAPQINSSEPHPLVRIANLEAKIIQLEQRLAKLESLQTPEQIALKPTASNSKEDSNDTKIFEIISIDTRLVESNDTWSKIAWKLTIKNLGFDLRRAHFGWMTLVMEENIALCPMDIRFFGGIGIMFDADGVAQLVEQFFWFWGGLIRQKEPLL